MSQPTIILLQTPQNPNFFTLFPKFTFPRKLSLLPQTLKLSPYDSIPTSITPYSLSSSSSSSSLQPNYKEEPDEGEEEEEDEELVIGDCVVFEEGIFQDPYLEHDFHLSATTNPRKTEIKPENLIPHEWKQVQAEINITKKERREIAQKWEFGRRLEKRRLAMEPIGLESGSGSGSVEERMRKYRDAKLAQLKPVVLDKPSSFPVEKQARNEKGMEELERSEMGRFGSSCSSSRVVPKNPRLAVYGGTLDDITFFFNSGKYNPDAAQKSQGTGKLFTKEEKALLNQRIPNLAAAASDKWQPLHTLVASGEFYLVNALLKHNVDINAVDKDGLTALHRAILGKKQAIFNYLLRESANPFVREKDGATLMHYAVRMASSPMIKILLLYNVNINLQDDEGWTPLHLAVQSRRTDIVRLLLIKGADKTLKNRDGLTPVDLCLYCGRDTKTYELLKLLKKKYKKRY